MSALPKHDVTSIPTDYKEQHEKASLSGARKKKLLIRRLTTFFICAGVIGFLIISTLISQSSTLNEKRAEQKELNNQIALLQTKETELNEQIARLNDDEYLAKLARKDLLLSKEGEIIFNIPGVKNKNSENGK